jgi:hypothetical protein
VGNEVTNDAIFEALMGLKGDLGGLTAKSDLFLKGLENHGTRISLLEGCEQRQKGAVKVWGLIATGVATVAGAAIEWLRH